MGNSSFGQLIPVPIKFLIINIVAVITIFLVPALSHLLFIPVYMIEPMRIMVILAIIHTGRFNAYILALSLPMFSFIVTSHPEFYKMILITAELCLNVFLFYVLGKKMNGLFAAISSILLSKIAYYVAKTFLLNIIFLQDSHITIPIYVQLIMTIILSIYAWLMLRKYAGK